MDPPQNRIDGSSGDRREGPGAGAGRRTSSGKAAIKRRRAKRTLLLLAPLSVAAAAIVAASSSSPQAVPASATVRPLADGSGRAGRSAPDWPRSPVLRVGGRPRRSAYLRFRVPRGTRSARLWLYVTGGPRRVPIAAVRVRGSTRRALTTAGRSNVSGTVGRTRSGRLRRWISIDVSAAARKPGVVTLVLVSGSRRARLFSSREGGRPPRLVLSAGLARGTAPGGGPASPASPNPSGALPAIVYAPAAPTRFVSPNGDDTGNCTRADPCLTLNRAYAIASLGETVEMAGGSYPSVSVQRYPPKDGSTCVSDPGSGSCVVVMAAPNSTVSIGDLTLGSSNRLPGPAGLLFLSTPGQRIVSSDTSLWQTAQTALVGMSHRNYFMSGGSWVTLNGGEVGPESTPDGTHPEIQRVYGTSQVPQNVRFENVYFHDITTTSRTAHVDCLQVENGTNMQIVRNRFERCGSVGLRMSFGVETEDGPPTNVLIENNAFGDCADIPVSQCYYSAQLGVGRNVTVRNNSSTMSIQGPNRSGYNGGWDGINVRYVGNAINGTFEPCGPGYFSHNVVTGSPCGSGDRRVSSIGFLGSGDMRLRAGSAAINAGDPRDFPAIDALGIARPRGGAPDAGAYESG